MGPLAADRPVDLGEGFTIEMAEGLLPPGTRFELYGGKILATTPAAQWHSDVQMQLVDMLRRRGLVAGMKVGLRIAAKESRVLDVAAFRGERDRHEAYFDAEQISLAIEVVSPSTAEHDFKDKPIEYAKLGIPEFWRVQEDDEDQYIVEIFLLDPQRGRYVLDRTATLDELETE